MGSLIPHVESWLIVVGFPSAMLAAWRIGWRLERSHPSDPEHDPGTKFTDASMALLGLLLGFTFSMSLSRHEHRRTAVVDESNAIGDFYTCASLLKDPTRPRLQAVIREYTGHRLAISRGFRTEADLEETLRRSGELQTRMTEIAAEAISAGTPIAVPLTNSLNSVTSNGASRLAAYRDRLPWSILLLLVVSSIVPAFLMGKQQGSSRSPQLTGTLCFVFLVTLVIVVTLDLNQPGQGTIRVSQEPMERLIQSMSE